MAFVRAEQYGLCWSHCWLLQACEPGLFWFEMPGTMRAAQWTDTGNCFPFWLILASRRWVGEKHCG